MTADADLEVWGTPRASADLQVMQAPVTYARASASLVVLQPTPARATANLTVLPGSLPLFRRVAGSLVEQRIYRRIGGTLAPCLLFRRVDGELVPVAAGGGLTAPAVAATIGDGAARVDWLEVPGAVGYRITRAGGSATDVGPSVRAHTLSGLTNNTPVTIGVQALPAGTVAEVTVTPRSTATLGAYKPVMGAGGGPEPQQFTPLNSVVGPMLMRRSYDGALPSSFAASAAASDVAAGRHSHWSWKPSATGFVGSTSQQAAFTAFLNTIPAGHKVTIYCHHEPENNMSDFAGGIVGYGALQNKVADLVRAVGNPNLRFGPCFMGPWTFDTRSAYYAWIDQWATVMDWSKFDVIGIDPYSTIYPDGMSLEQILTVRNSGSGSGGSSVKSMLGFLSQFDIPIAIAEWGYYRKQPSGHTNSQPPVDPIPAAAVAAWITEAYAWFKRWNAENPPRVEGGKVRGSFIDSASWFNYTLMGSDAPLTGPLTSPTTTGPKIDAYRAVVADSKISGGSAPTPNFTAQVTAGSAPLTVTLSGSGTSTPTGYAWDFGDGTTSTAQNPTKTYVSPGTYTVTLTATNAFGAGVRKRAGFITVT